MKARHRLTQVLGILVIATCVICPISEMFDHWDHTARTGKDTESTLVMVALSVGLAIPTVGIIALPSLAAVTGRTRLIPSAQWRRSVRAEALDAVSKPPPPLRI